MSWSGAPADGEMDDRDVLALARAGGDDRIPADGVGGIERGLGLGDGAGLVRLDQRRIAGPGGLRAGDAGGIGDEIVVADDLQAAGRPPW